MTQVPEGSCASVSLARLLDATERVTGTELFAEVARVLAELSGMRYACVAELEASARVKTLALVEDGELAPGFVCALEGSPFEEAVRSGAPAVQMGGVPAGEVWPPVGQVPIESCVAIPVRGCDGGVLGILSVFDTEVRAFEPEHLLAFRASAARVGSELSHRERERAHRRECLALLAAGLAHDFNNILAGILGNAELGLLDAAEPLRALLLEVRDSALRAADLTRQLQACSGRGRLSLERLSVNRLLESMRTLLAGVASKHGATLEFSLASALPEVELDRVKMRHVLLNLVMNAGEALDGQPGSVCVSTGVVADGRHVFIDVTDTGRGMDGATASQIFEPFFTTKDGGRGLGLAAVQGILENHRGAVQVLSEQGRGTTVRVMLPVSEELERACGRAPEAGLLAEPKLVLVADDEPTVLRTAGRILSHHGYRVLLVRDGREAVETFAAHADEIALVLLDMSMPVMSGSQVLAEIRRIRPEVRVVFSTGHGETEVRRYMDGPTEFLQKPWLPGDLLAALTRTLDA